MPLTVKELVPFFSSRLFSLVSLGLVICSLNTSIWALSDLNELSNKPLVVQDNWDKDCPKDSPALEKVPIPESIRDVGLWMLCFSPQTQGYFATQRQAGFNAQRADSALYPSLTATWNGNRGFNNLNNLSSPNTSTTATLGLNYVLYNFDSPTNLAKSSEYTAESATATAETNLQALVWNGLTAYYQFKQAVSSYFAYVESEKTSRENLKSVESRYSVGLATPADKLQAETAVAQAILLRIQTQATIHNTYIALQSYIGGAVSLPELDAKIGLPNIPADSPLDSTKGFEVKTNWADFSKSVVAFPELAESTFNQLVSLAQKNRPEITAADKNIASAQAFYDSEAKAEYPSISLGASTNWLTQDYDHHGYINYNSRMAKGYADQQIGLTITAPLYSGNSSTYRANAANEQVVYALSQKQQTSNLVISDVGVAFNNWRSTKATVASSAALLASSEESLRVTQGRYNAGLANLIDLFNAISTLASARQQYSAAVFNYDLAKIQVVKSLGVLNLDNLQSLSNHE